MRRHWICFIQIILLCVCAAEELSDTKKKAFLNAFIDHLNREPGQQYIYEDGVITSCYLIDKNTYRIQVELNTTSNNDFGEIKTQNCTAIVIDSSIAGIGYYRCQNFGDTILGVIKEDVVADEETTGGNVVLTSNLVIRPQPVHLDNEVVNGLPTSGEEFIAVPREKPAPCIGCATHVDTQAAGVTELANLAVRQLDKHEPNIRHILNTVHDVERVVQVVNGVRYILTISVDYNNCSAMEADACEFQKICRVSILEKPWIKLPNGSKHRAIVANNCTEEWLFGDNGEIIQDSNKESSDIDNNSTGEDNKAKQHKPNPDLNDDIVKVHNLDVQAQPTTEKVLTYEQMRELEQQIISINQFSANDSQSTLLNDEVEKRNVDSELQNGRKWYNDNNVPNVTRDDKADSSVTNKRKAIDDLLNFFDFSNFSPKIQPRLDNSRTKRSFASDLKTMAFVEKFRKLKQVMDNARYIHKLAQVIVDYLNEMKINVFLKEVISAEEESNNNQQFLYMKVRVYLCNKTACNNDDATKICNGIVDNSNSLNPRVLEAFCLENEKEMPKLGIIRSIPLNDPLLHKLIRKAFKKIEYEQSSKYAMTIKRIVNPNTKVVSGILTTFSLLVGFTNCNKTTPIFQRINCTDLVYLGSKLCDITVHERPWINKKTITYICTDRPSGESFSGVNMVSNVSDSKVLEIAQEALQYLEIQSNRNHKQKLVEIKSVESVLVSGILTKVNFSVGYTKCPSGSNTELSSCELMEQEPLRNCQVQVWERSWLEDGRQVKVMCNDHMTKNKQTTESKTSRKKRGLSLVGGLIIADVNDPKYKNLAVESMQKYLQKSGISQHHNIVKIDNVTVQIVSGTLTKINFKISPTNCERDNSGKAMDASCGFNESDILNCQSEVWERLWLNRKDIEVNCNGQNIRKARHVLTDQKRNQIIGGILEHDTTDYNSKYQLLAEEGLASYLQNHGMKYHKIIKLEKIITQIVSGLLTKINFKASPTNCELGGNLLDCKVINTEQFIKCLATIWEKPWINSKNIDVKCTGDGSDEDKNTKLIDVKSEIVHRESSENKQQKAAGDPKEQDGRDNRYKLLAENSLSQYFMTSGTTKHYKIVKVDKVTTQEMSGKLTTIDFTVTQTNCQLDDKGQPSAPNCDVLDPAKTVSCNSEVLERLWLNVTQYTVNCQEKDREISTKRHLNMVRKENKPRMKRQVPRELVSGGQVTVEQVTIGQLPVEQVPLGQVTVGQLPVEQVPLGQVNQNSTVLRTQVEQNKTQLRMKIEQIATDEIYKTMAKAAMVSFFESHGLTVHYEIVKVVTVNTEIDKGTNTTIIEYYVSRTDCKLSCDGKADRKDCFVVDPKKRFRCIADVIEHRRDPVKYEVVCDDVILKKRTKREVNSGKVHNMSRLNKHIGVSNEQNFNDEYYKALAENSLSFYFRTYGITKHYKITKVNKVTSKFESTKVTTIEFTISPTNCNLDSKGRPNSSNCDIIDSAQTMSCYSEVCERPLYNTTQYTVNCQEDEKEIRTKRNDNMVIVKKRQLPERLPGGLVIQNETDEKYREMAEHSITQYIVEHALKQHLKVVEVHNVSTQVVSGLLTRIDFSVSRTNCMVNFKGKPESPKCNVIDPNDTISCNSKIWEQPWLNFTEYTVKCIMNESKIRKKKHVVVNELEKPVPLKDTTIEEYLNLAEKSLKKYLRLNNNNIGHRVVKVLKVTKQTLAGRKCTIEFKAVPAGCNFEKTAGNCLQHGYNKMLLCYAKIWNRPLLQIKDKDITVKCNFVGTNDVGQEGKTDINRTMQPSNELGILELMDSNNEDYKVLAEDSLKKYEIQSGTQNVHKVIKISSVYEQKMQGVTTYIDYLASPTTCLIGEPQHIDCEVLHDSQFLLKCHAQVWNRAATELQKIFIKCKTHNRKHASGKPYYKYRLDKDIVQDPSLNGNNKLNETNPLQTSSKYVGGVHEQDPEEAQYKQLAEQSLQQHMLESRLNHVHKLVEVESVTTQVVFGVQTNLVFTIAPTDCIVDNLKEDSDCKIDESKEIRCYSSVWERPWLSEDQKRIEVTCVDLGVEINEDLFINNVKIQYNDTPNQSQRVKRNVNLETINRDFDNNIDDSFDDDMRSKRLANADDDYIEEEVKNYYADRAISHYNSQTTTNNLHKVLSIHDVQRSLHMKTIMVRMYIEIAMTYCLRKSEERDLNNCVEVEGLPHKNCLAKLFPSPNDEFVVKQVSIVCDDDPQNFESATGLDIREFIKASIRELEKSPDVIYKLAQVGEPYMVPSLKYSEPIQVNFLVASFNCTKDKDPYSHDNDCELDTERIPKQCRSYILLQPNTKNIRALKVVCRGESQRKRRSISMDKNNATNEEMLIQELVHESLEKVEMSSLHRYKLRVLSINGYSSTITTGRVTTIDFDVGYTNCLKYEWVQNISTCGFIEHLPRKHCVSQVWERLWSNNGKLIEVNCEDDETALEQRIEFDNTANAVDLANEALKHIEAKYPHPRKQKVVRIFSLEKQSVAGLHYRLKLEVGLTSCFALSGDKNCTLVSDAGINKFCRVNIWLRPWTDHPPAFRVVCDYQDGGTDDIYRQIQAEQLFHNFLVTHKPSYLNDPDELRKRFDIFKNNINRIHDLNIHERGTATYVITKFADLSYEEFSSKYLGLKLSLKDDNQVPMRSATIPSLEIPEKFDWRDFDAVTEVKDQGSCGSCWAFSVTGNIEGQWKMKSGKLVSLSEQELVDCDSMDQGCNGGLPDNAYRAIEQLGGLETESDYPYEGENDKCAFNKTLAKVQISGAVNISSNETDMAKWLVHNGPISIGINANAMQFYMGGVSHPWRVLCNPTNIDHGVLIVGYGIKEYPLFNKRLPYWLIKNSWGPSWGEQGYYRVFRGDGTCGVNQMASSSVI